MFVLLAFAVVGGTYAAIDRFGLQILALIAGAILLGSLLVGLEWVNDSIGTTHFVIHSWQALSGVQSGGQVTRECSGGAHYNPFLNAFMDFLGVIILLIDVLLAIVMMICLPGGIIMSIGGSIHSLITRKPQALAVGLGVLAIGLLITLVTGLSFRLVHTMSGVGC